MDKDSLMLLLTQGVSVEEIGRRFNRHPSTVASWMAKFGLEAPNREKYAAKGGIERERLEELVEKGMTIAEIAEAVGLNKTSVRHWLKRHGLRTRNRRGPRDQGRAQRARAEGLAVSGGRSRCHGTSR